IPWATVTQLDKYTIQVTVEENTGPARNGLVFIKYNWGQNIMKSVTQSSPTAVPPAVPGNPSIASSTCGQVVLQRTGTPPSGVTWYWQTTATGTSTAYSTATRTV